MQQKPWQKLFNDFIGGLINISIVAIVLFFTAVQTTKFFYLEMHIQALFLGVGTVCLLILFIIGLIAFVEDKATPLLNRSNNKVISGTIMIAIGFFLLMPTFYTLFLADLMKIK
ncbi:MULTISPECIES: hypothetical protein [Acinetobacter]|jgi:hypothetical protein|uniref:hypothetical protein n=1 Tax=Acinetobacter TaxID=469 RepID=UPI0032B5EB08